MINLSFVTKLDQEWTQVSSSGAKVVNGLVDQPSITGYSRSAPNL